MSLNSTYLTLAVLAGAGVAVQAVINVRLRAAVGFPLWAAATQSLVGVSALIIVALLSRQPPDTAGLLRAPWWAWLGGLLGALYVALSIIVTPRLGAALMLAATI